MCVYDFLKENDFAPFPRHHIQSFARQLLKSVACTSIVSNRLAALLIDLSST